MCKGENSEDDQLDEIINMPSKSRTNNNVIYLLCYTCYHFFLNIKCI